MASGAGTPWTDAENDATVAAYFAMLAEELAGRGYNKAGHNRRLQARIGRGQGAIEYKHGNISAVLDMLGAPWIDGYKPAPNFQHSLIDAVKRWLDRDSDWLNRHSKLFAPAPPPVGFAAGPAGLIVGPPPTKSNAPPAKRDELQAKIAHAFDFAGRDQRNRALGQSGEALVFAYEQATLNAEHRPDLAKRVKWVSRDEGDGAGYDIASFRRDGHRRLIEVKTTNGWERTPFHITRNEYAVSKARAGEWCLFRLWNFAREPRAFELYPPLKSHVSLFATSYEAHFH